ncbi:hypothetical protein [Flocculibacter collagenilyticus]|uniref:hypothetical protein n=1 Tax=Flocculibacter collagenilyticus TaxID=2744479 RepID=UPI0018F790BB|nr:hypothetical protein [Flocculibacter collagenilyticus]
MKSYTLIKPAMLTLIAVTTLSTFNIQANTQTNNAVSSTDIDDTNKHVSQLITSAQHTLSNEISQTNKVNAQQALTSAHALLMTMLEPVTLPADTGLTTIVESIAE